MTIKKVALVLTTILITNMDFAYSYTNEEKSTNFIVTPSVAYRYDVFKWSIPHPEFGDRKNSELTWKNYIIQPSVKIELEPQPNQFTFLVQTKYGCILKNPSESKDQDWHSQERRGGRVKTETSSLKLSSVKGNILDLSGAVGYSFDLPKNNLLTFYLGYDYSDYQNKNYGIQQLVANHNDLLYPVNQLIAKYYFKTKAPWIGLSVNTQLNDKFLIIPTIKLYSFKYIGQGYWLLRDDLKQDPSFKHKAKGIGLGFDLDFLYKFSDNLDFKINLATQKFKMKKGQFQFFYAEKVREDMGHIRKLYDLGLLSSSVSGGIRYKL